MILLLIGLGSFFAVEFIKAAAPAQMPSGFKLVLALAASFGISTARFQHETLDLFLYGAAGAGLAVGVHRLARLLTAAGDYFRIQVMRNRRS